MSDLPPVMTGNDINDNDKLMAALSYFLTPIVPVIVLLVETMKARPYQRYHAVQALGLFGAEMVFIIFVCVLATICNVLGTLTGGILNLLSCILFPLFFAPLIIVIYYAIIAYAKPAYFEIPVVTQFMKRQGWLNA